MDKLIFIIVYIVARTIHATLRHTYVLHENGQLVTKSSAPKMENKIMVMWHENAMPSVMSFPNQGICPLISLSKDGSMAVFFASRIGYDCLRGSSSRGGKAARDEAARLLRSGKTVAITVDGPKGPRHVPKPGFLDLARATGAQIVTIQSIADRKWVLHKTWDQTVIPKPFSKITTFVGMPITWDESRTFEAQIAEIQNLLKANPQKL